MRTTFVCWTVALAALGAGCTSASKDQTDLETHRTLFSEPPLLSYSFDWQLSCFCGPETVRPIHIIVSGSTIVSAAYVDDEQPVSESIRTSLKTIDGVFDLIQQRLDEHADEVTVTYDPDRGYPKSVFIDISKSASDEEMSLQLSNFVTPADTGKPALRTKLAAQRLAFVEPASYSFTSGASCFCAPEYTQAIRISVTDGIISRAVYRDSKEPVADNIRGSLRTLPSLFDYIAKQLREDSGWRSNELTFEYDAALHYPTLVKSSSSEIADLGGELRLSDFVTPADAL